ncbi:small ribosomal subunit Rsm22 family protein [uncultured Treponema sp.]|uniref:small ribosomal subunit Rsm22 family protein n=1 Tax=uncultured Treponema sp. TaxID=162155 RepID=UPI0025F1FFF1|nr:small ribosomal subunit Rsm22 family protein [uncultured Treponema sp.]
MRTDFKRQDNPNVERVSSTSKTRIDRKRTHAHRKELSERKKSASIRREMFDFSAVSEESRQIIEKFDEIVESVRGMSGKQKVSLYGAIKNLSHQLTDDRNSRRLGYMNEATYISAYINYFMWWNLVRQTLLFANLPKSSFEPLVKSENPVAIDIGSGTLTVVIALWLARPELRSKKIKWYCMDLSQTALSAGEDLYLSIAARTLKGASLPPAAHSVVPTPPSPGAAPQTPDASSEPWTIIRVKGAFGTDIKEKADFITCGNVFNEILQRNEMPTDFLAKKYTGELVSYLKNENSAVLLVEPGDPHSARFISLMRDALIRQNFLPVAPCPHIADCPMAGRTNGKTTNSYGKNAKWCNFAFDAESAPVRLKKLSEKAGLQKERASLSFIVAKKDVSATVRSDERRQSQKTSGTELSEKMFIRVASDFIRLPELHKSGYYACSKYGMLLAIDESHIQPKNGELLQIKTPEDLGERDKKSGALIVRI